jgi:4-oxalocrotonate tautomerase family enzyme
MPNLNLYLVAGYSDEQKSRLLGRLTDAVVYSLDAPRSAVRIFLIELQEKHISVGGITLSLLREQQAPDVVHAGPTIHAMLIAGRNERQKSALIASLTAAVGETLGIPADTIRIIVADIPNTDFGMNGVTAKSLGR